jgi:hypothetical protein
MPDITVDVKNINIRVLNVLNASSCMADPLESDFREMLFPSAAPGDMRTRGAAFGVA